MLRFFTAIVAVCACTACNESPEFDLPILPDEPFRQFTLGPHLIDGYSALRTIKTKYNDKSPKLWGVIDEKNNIIVQPSYDSISALPPYFVAIDEHGSWLYRQDGSKVFKEPFSRFEAPIEGFGRVYDFKRQVAFFSGSGEILGGHWLKDRNIKAMQDGMVWDGDKHFLRADGQLIQIPEMMKHSLHEFKHGLGIGRIDTCCSTKAVTFFNKHLNPVTTKRWIDAENFNGNYGAVQSEHGWDLVGRQMNAHPLGPFAKIGTHDQGFYHVIRKSGEHNIITDSGELLLSEWQEELSPITHGMAAIKKGDQYNLINSKGELLSADWFDDVHIKDSGIGAVWRKGQGYNYFSTDGKLINNDWFLYQRTVPKGLKTPLRLQATGFVNKLGSNKTAINRQYKLIEGEPFHHIKAVNRLMITDFHSDKYSDVYHQILDLDGTLLHEEAFKDISTLSHSGFFVVKRADSKANLIDSFSRDGRFVSKHWYDKVFRPRFNQKCALVRDNDKGNFMFTDGSLLSEEWGDKAYSTFTAGQQDMRAIKLNGKYIVMNENCDQITEERFPKLISKFGHSHFCVSKSFTGLTDWHKLSYDGSTSPVESEDDCFKQE